jgi:hypothetical protein
LEFKQVTDALFRQIVVHLLLLLVQPSAPIVPAMVMHMRPNGPVYYTIFFGYDKHSTT